MSTNYFVAEDLSPQRFSESPDGDTLRVAPAILERDQHDPILMGESATIRRLRSQVERIAPYFRTALIRGEIGAGKQTVARSIHARSPGAEGPFIVSNATSLAEAIASEVSSPIAASLLDSANGGTLYLDGVGELPFALQAGLFRFVRACEDRRVASYAGRSDLPRPDTRILTATHRDLRTLSAIGQFRQDLYMRLSVVEIFVPPLRQRMEDIPILAAWLLRRLAERSGQNLKVLTQATLTQLADRHWPNNLTELERVVGQAAALADGHTIEPRHLLSLVEPASANLHVTPAIRLERLQDVIQQHVLEVLTRCGGNKLRAAELLGISRSTLYRMLDANSVSPRDLTG
jgi:DNA-binding NtrC family response regulator